MDELNGMAMMFLEMGVALGMFLAGFIAVYWGILLFGWLFCKLVDRIVW